MGYYSQVALAVSKEIMPQFLSVLAKEPEARALVFKQHETMVEDYNGDGTLFVVWSDIKWYENFPEINAINSFVEECEADMLDDVEHSSEHIRFVRIGESNDDAEEKGYLHSCDIGVIRSLAY